MVHSPTYLTAVVSILLKLSVTVVSRELFEGKRFMQKSRTRSFPFWTHLPIQNGSRCKDLHPAKTYTSLS